MVGPNTMLASSHWIKRNMMGTYSEKLDRPLTEAEIRVQQCIERLSVPDWYKNYSKSVKFLKNDTPIESRPPTWRAMKGKARSPRKTPSKQHVPENIQAKPMPSPRKAKPMPSPRKSLNSNYRIARKADNLRKNERLSISISPSSSDNESPAMNSRLSRTLSNSHTFPRVQPSRKIQNINIVFPKNFTPKPPRRNASPPIAKTSTPTRTQYTLTKSIVVEDLADSDAHHSSNTSTQTLGQNSHTSFLFAEVEPGGVTTRVRVFAGMDSDEDEYDDEEERPLASPHTRFFSSRNKSSELERIVQTNTRRKRGDSLIRDIIGELDRSIAESAARRNNDSGSDGSNASGEFVKSMVRALQRESYCEEEEDYSSDSELAKSTSISFKSLDDDLGSSSSCGDEEEDDEEEETCTPLPNPDYEEEEEEEEEEIYWIPSKIHELPRTSSRLSVLSRDSSRSGFQCTSGRCSPGLSPIKSDRARDEWTATLASHRSHKSAVSLASSSSRQLFRIDESQPLAVGIADSGCYSDRTQSRTPNYCNDAAVQIYSSSSSTASTASSPTLQHLDGITTEMLIDICGRHQFSTHKSIAV